MALVELCKQWDAHYLHNHGSRCAETLALATYVLAPTVLANELRTGVMASSAAYCEHLRQLGDDLRRAFDERVGRYRRTDYPTPSEVSKRAERLCEVATILRNISWAPNRIIDCGLPRLVSPFFDGERLCPAAHESSSAGLDDAFVVFAHQKQHDHLVLDTVRDAAHRAGLVPHVASPPSEGETVEEREQRRDRSRALLDRACVVATEFSNLAYQAALGGRRVLYCTWRSQTRPLPLLIHDSTFAHVREAAGPDEVLPLLVEAATGKWAPAAAPVSTTPAALVVEAIKNAIATR